MSTRPKNHAFVFNCNYNGLSIIQELGRHGVPVHALDSKRDVGTFSRYARYHRCPDPLYDEDAFIHFLIEKGHDFHIKPVLFPTNDQWAGAIARYKKDLEPYYHLCVADAPVVNLLINKDRFYRWAMDNNYPVPPIYTAEVVMSGTPDIFPLIAKPIARRLPNLCNNNPEIGAFLDVNRMTIISNIEDFCQFQKKFANYQKYYLFQEYIPGMGDQMYTVGIYANREHEVIGLFTGRKVRGYPPETGDCIVGQGESIPDNIIITVKNMVRELQFTGIAQFEYKKDPVTGELRLLEINPRSWSWIGITPVFEVSLPWIAYVDLTGIETIQYTENEIKNGDIIFLHLLDDLKNSLYLYRKTGYSEYHKGFMVWIDELKGRKRVYAEFSWDDPLVALYAMWTFGRSILTSLFRTPKEDHK